LTAPICANRTRNGWIACSASRDSLAAARSTAIARPTRLGSGAAVAAACSITSHAPDFVSEADETRTAIASVAAALGPLVAAGSVVTWTLDAGFDDVAVWSAIWAPAHRLVCRLAHRDRWVRDADGVVCQLGDLAAQLRPLAEAAAAMVVQKVGQSRPKLQPVTATVAAVPLQVAWRPGLRTTAEGEERTQACGLVEVRLQRVAQEPWWLLTDRPVTTAEEAVTIFRLYCQRWAIEDAFKVAKTCLGWEDVQVLDYAAVRLLVALGWVTAGFLFDLGVTLEWGEVRLLRRLGGGEDRSNRPPGKIVLTRGLRRLLDYLAMTALLADEEQRHGLPPRIAALLGRSPTP
jgi:Transposase DDE domain